MHFYYSPNDGQSWILFASTPEDATVLNIFWYTANWDTTYVPDGSYLFKVIAEGADGLRAENTSDDVFIIQNDIPPPLNTSCYSGCSLSYNSCCTYSCSKIVFKEVETERQ